MLGNMAYRINVAATPGASLLIPTTKKPQIPKRLAVDTPAEFLPTPPEFQAIAS